jgi:hypothetical protein
MKGCRPRLRDCVVTSAGASRKGWNRVLCRRRFISRYDPYNILPVTSEVRKLRNATDQVVVSQKHSGSRQEYVLPNPYMLQSLYSLQSITTRNVEIRAFGLAWLTFS